MKLAAWLVSGELRAHPGRMLVALMAIAIGVALGLAVQLINASAAAEFSQAVRATTGQADFEIRGPRAGFDERVLELVAADPAVAVASPMVEVDARVLDGKEEAHILKVIGIDPFRAAALTPALIGAPADDDGLALLADDALFLSPAAQRWLGVSLGQPLRLQVGLDAVTLRIAGGLPGARQGLRIATMDIGAAQWRLARLGTLTRIAVRLAPGNDGSAARTRIAALLPAGVFIADPEDADVRASSLSRAYRVNLDVLALVALFTGAFLVFSTQTLAVARRRGEFALLRTLGWPRERLLIHIVAEGAALGLIGSLLGAILGIGVARFALDLMGGDLGGGYFAGIVPELRIERASVAGFVLLGTLAAVAGSFMPALEIARAAPAQALKSGAETLAHPIARRGWPALALVTGAVLTRLPAIDGLPIAGYLAIVCWLVGGIALMPVLAGKTFAVAAAWLGRHAGRWPLAFLSLERLAAAPAQAGVALAGVVASFALMVAMAIMVGSFRDSVDRWLGRVLAAPLYFRVAAGGNSAFVPSQTLAAIAAQPGLERCEWLRIEQIDLDPRRPSITLMARTLDKRDPGRRIPLTAPTLPAEALWPDSVPVWVSEAMVDLYGWSPGSRQSLPLAGRAVAVTVAGVWRDFARQHGTVTLSLDDYRRLTGDQGITDGALWPKTGVSAAELAEAIRDAVPATRQLEFAEAGGIRAASLRIFDRSFAITYLLEGVAIVIGLAGIGASFSAQVLARAREFGMLRHLGVTRRELMRLLGFEACGLTLFGIAAGAALGLAVALVLIRVVNPQSFHWNMDLAVPWRLLGMVSALLIVASVTTALIATRQATGLGPLRAVREDW
ncbi:FtsX-like permease family protein [Sulfuricystis multivorans]|uniref:FtsX-like permease family protein n=1 Tax=Sulfuricystis multivorans TaxID=2211108 RepID=UPI000F831BEA|nr:ABC transporter permease [Sulfuricystis multivorans]